MTQATCGSHIRVQQTLLVAHMTQWLESLEQAPGPHSSPPPTGAAVY